MGDGVHAFTSTHITSNANGIIYWWLGKKAGLNVLVSPKNTEDKQAEPNRIILVEGKEDCQVTFYSLHADNICS